MRASEFIAEELNKDCFNPAFNDTQHFDDLTYRATYEQDTDGKRYFMVKVFNDRFERVGLFKFRPIKDANNNYWLESAISAVQPKYQNKGISRNVYAYVRMLGNTIKPSNDQTSRGREMWQRWQKSGDAEHLMREEITIL